MQSKATTVAQYLASLPADRRAAISAVRDAIRQNLDADYEEGMQYGMIGYYVPFRVFPAGYHCSPDQPLPFASLSSQKSHMSLHLMGIYMGGADSAAWFQAAWAKTGKKLDMGKACVRFRRLEDIALDVIGEAIRRMPAKKYIGIYTQNLASRGMDPSGKKVTASAPKAKAPVKAPVKAMAKAPSKKAGAKKVGAQKTGKTGTGRR